MKLTKRSDAVSKDEKQLGVSRRTFMRNTTLATAGSVAAAGMFAPGMMKKPRPKRWIPQSLWNKNALSARIALWLWCVCRSARWCLGRPGTRF